MGAYDYWYLCPKCRRKFAGDGRPVNICPLCLVKAKRVD